MCNKKIKKQLFKLWGKVGFIVNLSQMIEYNLANILAFDEILREFDEVDSMYVYEFNEFAKRANKKYAELESRPFGAGIKQAEKVKFFTEDFQKELERICQERNYVVHRLFKEDLKEKMLETDPTYYFDRLENLIADMNQVNEELTEIFIIQKAEYKLVW